MPTYETLPRFTTDLDRLTPEQRGRFRQAVTAFVHGLRAGGHFRAGLRVKRVQRTTGIYELAWSMGTRPAGGATWEYGPRCTPASSTSCGAGSAPRHPLRSLTTHLLNLY
ncbi:hypothetical protein ABTY96_44130 [Streptomyces sp. NPDC096057]|uniref:hypothetical protein n=1 Tax=Streptomyces sp. NPDC096057 TaxID=3155543 RepID=UPI00332E0D72